jgi:PQQ-like domain
VRRDAVGRRRASRRRGLRALGRLALAVVAVVAPAGAAPASPGGAVLQYHKNATRDGHYVDPAVGRSAAPRLHRDPAFRSSVPGPTYAQPLFWAATRPNEKDLLFVATAQARVHALDGSTGAEVWQRSLGAPVGRDQLPCGNIDPLGVTGTPVIDAASRTLFVDAMTTAAGGAPTHRLAALSIDDGSMRPGWPVDVAAARPGSLAFNAAVQNQRGALALLGGTLYVPYGGHFGDCGDYHGWVVGVPTGRPASAGAWATRATGGGIWAPGGIAADGGALYVATGNTFGASSWGDGESVIRLGPGPSFSREPADFFAPATWAALDRADADLGGSGPILVDVPGATPSQLVVALGKDGNAYLIDRPRMGGIGGAVAARRVSTDAIIGAAAAYTTGRGTYVVFPGRGIGCPRGQAGDLTAIRIDAASPPTMTVAWCAAQHGRGSPIVTTTDGRSDAIVWSVGAGGDGRLRGFDGETGQVVFDGGPGEAMSGVQRYQTPVVAKGRIFVVGDREVYAFTAR